MAVKKQTMKGRFMTALFMLLVTAVALTSASYAWFTSNTTVTLGQLDVKVETGSGIQVSLDAENWKASLTTADIKQASQDVPGNTNQVPDANTTMNPVSTVGNVDANGFMEMYLGSLKTDAGNYILTSEKQTDTKGNTGNYIAFDMYIKSDNANNTPFYLAKSSKVTNTGTNIQNAARVAVINEGHAAFGTAAGTIRALKKSSGTADFIWEPNANLHTAAAVTAGNTTYQSVVTESEGTPTTVTTNTILKSYPGVKAVIAEATKVPQGATVAQQGTYLGKVTPTLQTGAGSGEATAIGASTATSSKVTDLVQGVTKFRVYLWIEGQDIDCENTSSGQTTMFDLIFTQEDVNKITV